MRLGIRNLIEIKPGHFKSMHLFVAMFLTDDGKELSVPVTAPQLFSFDRFREMVLFWTGHLLGEVGGMFYDDAEWRDELRERWLYAPDGSPPKMLAPEALVWLLSEEEPEDFVATDLPPPAMLVYLLALEKAEAAGKPPEKQRALAWKAGHKVIEQIIEPYIEYSPDVPEDFGDEAADPC